MQDRVLSWRTAIDAGLGHIARSHLAVSDRLSDSAEYVLTGGGKRWRGLLTLAIEQDLRGSENAPARAISSAVAIEALHAASLIHDDLPALDNDDMRRGKPSCHKAFGEATAILAGDALVGAALHVVLADEALPSDLRARIAKIVSQAWMDLCIGQQLDISSNGGDNSTDRARMIQLKTGALFGAAAACGALCGGLMDGEVERYREWGVRVGECFQALDDLSDGDRPERERAAIAKECERVVQTIPTLLGRDSHDQTSSVTQSIVSCS